MHTLDLITALMIWSEWIAIETVNILKYMEEFGICKLLWYKIILGVLKWGRRRHDNILLIGFLFFFPCIHLIKSVRIYRHSSISVFVDSLSNP